MHPAAAAWIGLMVGMMAIEGAVAAEAPASRPAVPTKVAVKSPTGLPPPAYQTVPFGFLRVQFDWRRYF